MRLYKEVPAEAPPSPPLAKPRGKEAPGAKGKGAKSRGKKAKIQGGLGGSLVPPPAEPSWELLGSSTEELQAVGEDLTGSKANAEADIGYQVRNHFAGCLCIAVIQHQQRKRCSKCCRIVGNGGRSLSLRSNCFLLCWLSSRFCCADTALQHDNAVHSVQKPDSNLAGQGKQLQPAEPIVADEITVVVMGTADPVLCIPKSTKSSKAEPRGLIDCM